MTQVTHADGSYSFYTHIGRADKIVDEEGVTRIVQHDVLGRLTGVCEVSSNSSMPNSGSPANCGLDMAGTGFLTTYTYRTGYNETIVTQGVQARAVFVDLLGRPLTVQEPEMFTGDANTLTTYSYAYNLTGLQVIRTRPRASQTSPDVTTTTTTQYDSLGRVISVSYNDGTPTKSFSYDTTTYWGAEAPNQANLKGRLSLAETYLSQFTSPNAGTLFSYDSMGRTSKMWECQPSGCGNPARDRELDFSYDYAGRELSQSDPTTGVVNYTYTPAGEITSIYNTAYNNAQNPSNYVSSVVNGVAGPTSYHLGNGLNEVLTYDTAGRGIGKWLCSGSLASTCTGGTQLYGMGIIWKGPYLTNSADIITNTGGPYTYDEFGRLKSYNGNLGLPTTFSWTYDRWGNRWSQTPGDSVTFNGMNHKLDGSTGYDAAGNIIQDAYHKYAYDAENNLINVDSGQTASYVYDALNQRVQIQVPSGSPNTLEFTYDFAGRRITTWDANANFGIQGQAWWGNMPLAYRGAKGWTYFQQADWVGTQRILTDYAGNVLAAYKSNPFGDGYSASGQDDNRLHYGYLEHDAESGSEHAQYRQYDTAVGVWMSMDPYAGSYDWINPQSFNRYAYVGNNPLSFIDPGGLDGGNPLGGAGTLGGCIGAIATGGENPVADFGCGLNALLYLFGGGPSFHGSLLPRPGASDPLDDHLGVPSGYSVNPGIAGALGLPDAGCEFGACGPGISFGGAPGSVPGQLSGIASKIQQGKMVVTFLTNMLAQTLPERGLCDAGVFAYAGTQSEKGFLGYLREGSISEGWTHNVLLEKGDAGVAGGGGGLEGLYFIPFGDAGGGLLGASKQGVSYGVYVGTPEKIKLGIGGGGYLTSSWFGGCGGKG